MDLETAAPFTGMDPDEGDTLYPAIAPTENE